MKKFLTKIVFIVIALVYPYTYDLFLERYAVIVGVILGILGIDYKIISERYYFFDSIFCMVVLLFYLFCLYAIMKSGEIGKNNLYSEDVPIDNSPKKYFVRTQFSFFVALGMFGISGLWLDFVDKVLYDKNILGLGESMDSFAETWADNGESYVWVFLSVVLLGPIVEEILFRGIQYHYAEKIAGKWLPVFFTGISFGVWHGEPIQIVYTAVMGIIIAIVYRYTRSLFEPIMIHIFNNFFSALPPFLDTERVQLAVEVLSLCMIIPLIFTIVYLCKTIRKRDISEEIKNYRYDTKVYYDYRGYALPRARIE